MKRTPHRAHPHVCGEHAELDRLARGRNGSSPRMRGTRRREHLRANQQGLIPTYAGNTRGGALHVLVDGAHPHVCGEHGLHFQTCLVLLGSSPRMRGTLRVASSTASVSGLIPTYAGNTRTAIRSIATPRAHPHVCGEHAFQANIQLLGQGSSPRMRGTPVAGREPAHCAGLIPTYAGNTRQTLKKSTVSWAHPHVCGEHARIVNWFLVKSGSSPRMRGTR